jgi:hypothetical protein
VNAILAINAIFPWVLLAIFFATICRIITNGMAITHQLANNMNQALLSSMRTNLISILSALDCVLSQDKKAAEVTTHDVRTCTDPAATSDVNASDNRQPAANFNTGYDINLRFGITPGNHHNARSDTQSDTKQNKPTCMPIQAMPDAISRLEQALEWMTCLTTLECKLVWMRAANVSWDAICDEFGFARTAGWRKWTHALDKMSALLNQQALERFNSLKARYPLGTIEEIIEMRNRR